MVTLPHQHYLTANPYQDEWVATCACGWLGEWETSRWAALLHHTDHLKTQPNPTS